MLSKKPQSTIEVESMDGMHRVRVAAYFVRFSCNPPYKRIGMFGPRLTWPSLSQDGYYSLMPSLSETIANYFAATRAMDSDGFVAAFATNAISYDPMGAPPHQGHDAIRQFITGVLSGFETVGLTEDSVFISGNSAAVKWTGRGRTKSGRDITFEGIDVIEGNAEGRIQTLRAFWDPAPVMEALQA